MREARRDARYTILKEFGSGQFEVTMGPQQGVTIADHSLITRELVGLVARELGYDQSDVHADPRSGRCGQRRSCASEHARRRCGNPVTYDPRRQARARRWRAKFVALAS